MSLIIEHNGYFFCFVFTSKLCLRNLTRSPTQTWTAASKPIKLLTSAAGDIRNPKPNTGFVFFCLFVLKTHPLLKPLPLPHPPRDGVTSKEQHPVDNQKKKFIFHLYLKIKRRQPETLPLPLPPRPQKAAFKINESWRKLETSKTAWQKWSVRVIYKMISL